MKEKIRMGEFFDYTYIQRETARKKKKKKKVAHRENKIEKHSSL